MKLPELRPRQPLSGVALSAAVGIVVADRCALPISSSLAVAAVAFCVVVAKPRAWLCWFFAVIAFATLHTLRHGHSDARQLASEFVENHHVVRAKGIVWSEPEKPAF